MTKSNSATDIDAYLSSLISLNALPFKTQGSDRYLVQNTQSRFLWPGCIFDNISLSNGNSDPKTFTLCRSPITLSSSNRYVSKQIVDNPTRSSVMDKVNEMWDFSGAQDAKFQSFESQRLEELSFKLSFIAQGFVAAVEGSGYMENINGVNMTCVTVVIDSFAISIDDWNKPSDLFEGETLEQVQSSITADSAPTIISQIHVGRVLNILCSEVNQGVSFEAAIKATYDAVVSGSGEIAAKYQNALNETRMCVFQAGVSKVEFPSGFEGIKKLISDFSASKNTGSVIGLQMRNLDNTPCGIPAGLEYGVSDIYVKATKIKDGNIKLFGYCEFIKKSKGKKKDDCNTIITMKFDFENPGSYNEDWKEIQDTSHWHKLPFANTEGKTCKVFGETEYFGFKTEFWDYYSGGVGKTNEKIGSKYSPSTFDLKYRFIPGLGKGKIKLSPNTTYTLSGNGDTVEVSYHVWVKGLEDF